MKPLRQFCQHSLGSLLIALAIMAAIEESVAAEMQEPAVNVLKDLIERAKTNYTRGDATQARLNIDAIVNFAERDSLDRLLKTEKEISDFCASHGDMEQAVSILKRSVSVAEITVGPDDMSTALALANLASFQIRTRNFTTARQIFLRCLQITEKSGMGDSLGAAAICEALRDCETELGLLGEAESNAKRAFEIRERLQSQDKTALIWSRANLEMIYVLAGKFSAALPLAVTNILAQENVLPTKVIDSVRKESKSDALASFLRLSRDRAILLADSYGRLGLLQRTFGKFAEARDHVLRSRFLHEQIFGRKSFAFANTLILEAGIFGVQKQYDKALPLLKEAYEISQGAIAKSDTRWMNLLNDLAIAYQNTGQAELKLAVSPRILHLATHGFYLSDQELKQTNSSGSALTGNSWNLRLAQVPWENPMVRCGIALAGANHANQVTNATAEDGLLTGLEASLLNLQGTELVILSACDSGSGDVKIGEGVMSLRRAFRIAGAQTVLASHWKVSDKATTQLMTEFMRRWRSGEPRAQAWRQAQLSLLHSKEFSNPYFWAAFTLTGQWR